MRSIIPLILLLLLIPGVSSAQEGLYYYGTNSKPVTQLADAVSYKEVKKKTDRKYVLEKYLLEEGKWKRVGKEKIKLGTDGNQTIHYNNNTIFPRKFYRSMEKVAPGEYRFEESTLNGEIRNGTSSAFLPLHLEGQVVEYHPNRELKSKSVFRDNQLVSNENWLSDGTKYIDSLFYSVDEEPEYQMGDDFFKTYLITNLEKSGIDMSQIEDLVILGWVVMENGELNAPITLAGKSRQLNEFLVNTISELPGYWTPALLDGAPVRYFMSIPLNFIQKEASFQEIELSPGGVMHYNKY